jgi:hypothetical protein
VPGYAALALAIASSACGDVDPQPSRHRLSGSCGPADHAEVVLDIFVDEVARDCDFSDDGLELRLVFAVPDGGGDVYGFDEDMEGGWGTQYGADGQETDVVEAWLVIESLDDDIASGSYEAAVSGEPQMLAGMVVDAPFCPVPSCP